MFTGFTEELDQFFLGLKFNNNREFFEAHREQFERAVMVPLRALCDELTDTVQAIDPQLDTRPARAISRIHRDLRFSKDKTPYREDIWIGYRRVGEARIETCGFFFDVALGQACWGCGFFQENRPVMDMLRRKMVQAPDKVLGVLTDPAFAEIYTVGGSEYKKIMEPPDSVPESLRALYRKKGVYAEHFLQDRALIYTPALVERLRHDFQAMAPFYLLLRGCFAEADT